MNARKKSSVMATVAARVYRAAALCHAGVADPRVYLHGVCLNKTGEIVSTNGHVLYCAPYDGEPLEGNLVFVPAKIPTQAITVDLSLVFIDNVSYVLAASKNVRDEIIARVLCEFIDGAGDDYPKYKSLFIGNHKESREFHEFAFDPKYLALIGKVFKPKLKGMMPMFVMYNRDTAFLSIREDEEMGQLLMMAVRL